MAVELKQLYIMDLDFNLLGGTVSYESCRVVRQWAGIGSIELRIYKDSTPDTQYLVEDNIIWLYPDVNKAGIIEYVKESVSQNGRVVLDIRAMSLNAFLNDRITALPAVGDADSQTGSRETVAKAWVTNNLISPTDTDREFNIVNATDTTLGDTITAQTVDESLFIAVGRVLAPQDLGFNISIDLANSRFEFDVDAGNDYSTSIYYGKGYGNISQEQKIDSSVNYKNVAYVGGDGTGATRPRTEVDQSSGSARRREIFVNGTGLSTAGERTEKGKQELASKYLVSTLDAEILTRQYQYETDWDLGDYVSVEGTKRQITSVVEFYQQGNTLITPVFDKPLVGFTGLTNSIEQRVAALEAQGN